MLHLTVRQVGLLVALVGVMSIAFHEPLARLDLIGARGGPDAPREARLTLARRIIIGAGIGCVLLAGVVVHFA
jgi:hypothetical protein